ncbi:MAG: hypothetical protein A2031_08030 [Deltaproteobacteria bacterium RBG_19FT_COMBO_43_11]|nr:MAG: hypothetical protein A2031_08030 [Deltaproteobacteria bacterium RBG_19FT_COMBO_43_11]
MKTLKVFLVAIILMAIMPSLLFAAGTITGTIERINTSKSKPLVIITLTCTAGAVGDGADAHLFPATVVNTLSGISAYDLRGLKLYSIVTVPGTTGPTDNSDLTITDRYGIDTLAAAGANIVDNATSNRVVANPDTAAVIITGNLTVNITGNIVDSAVTTIILELVGI